MKVWLVMFVGITEDHLNDDVIESAKLWHCENSFHFIGSISKFII